MKKTYEKPTLIRRELLASIAALVNGAGSPGPDPT
jgi:hypothetical protein